MGKLYIVPTPIGNLGDITIRALETLKSSDLILAESVSSAKRLLNHFEISAAVHSFHQHNEHQRLSEAVKKIQGNSITSYISEAGTPGISDPGHLLINACAEKGIETICLPGATAFVPALLLSTFPNHRFAFYGFPPHKKGRLTFFKEMLSEDKTVVFYESPHRLEKCLLQLKELSEEERWICVVKEISKIHEAVFRGSVDEVLKALHERNAIKGEFVVVLGGVIGGG